MSIQKWLVIYGGLFAIFVLLVMKLSKFKRKVEKDEAK
jgi:hypothetical protein